MAWIYFWVTSCLVTSESPSLFFCWCFGISLLEDLYFDFLIDGVLCIFFFFHLGWVSVVMDLVNARALFHCVLLVVGRIFSFVYGHIGAQLLLPLFEAFGFLIQRLQR